MKKSILVIVTFLVAGVFFVIGYLAVTRLFSPKQQEYQTEYVLFSIQAPANLTEETQSVAVPGYEPIELHIFSGNNGAVSYAVSYSDFPVDFIDQSDPEELLTSSRDGAVANLRGKILGEGFIALDGNPGIETTIFAPAEDGRFLIAKIRIYLFGNRLYQVMILAPEGEVSVKEMDEYLNSFQVTQK